MEADAVAAGDGDDFLELGGIEPLALLAPDRRLDRDRRDARDDASALGLIQHALQVVGRERGASRRQRHQRQVAQRLRAVAFILIEMAFFLDDHAARSPPASARTAMWFASVPVGMKIARSLPSTRAHSLLELFDDAAERVRVGHDPLLVEQAVQQGRVFERG